MTTMHNSVVTPEDLAQHGQWFLYHLGFIGTIHWGFFSTLILLVELAVFTFIITPVLFLISRTLRKNPSLPLKLAPGFFLALTFLIGYPIYQEHRSENIRVLTSKYLLGNNYRLIINSKDDFQNMLTKLDGSHVIKDNLCGTYDIIGFKRTSTDYNIYVKKVIGEYEQGLPRDEQFIAVIPSEYLIMSLKESTLDKIEGDAMKLDFMDATINHDTNRD